MKLLIQVGSPQPPSTAPGVAAPVIPPPPLNGSDCELSHPLYQNITFGKEVLLYVFKRRFVLDCCLRKKQLFKISRILNKYLKFDLLAKDPLAIGNFTLN